MQHSLRGKKRIYLSHDYQTSKPYPKRPERSIPFKLGRPEAEEPSRASFIEPGKTGVSLLTVSGFRLVLTRMLSVIGTFPWEFENSGAEA